MFEPSTPLSNYGAEQSADKCRFLPADWLCPRCGKNRGSDLRQWRVIVIEGQRVGLCAGCASTHCTAMRKKIRSEDNQDNMS